ncbi:hypothetical protein CSA56_04755 [candidate division KSB3 bacterium]|uniref:Murein biosynthesis integral membrane protein MurJ n=1 Tax=candidate division KSB3 bacterium TaxID=2044937 RepID=A0A2G6KI39_9BACT|nr:MAG: hypothetical protein CSA56_04755 [candidate division KSB3 bacterium]
MNKVRFTFQRIQQASLILMAGRLSANAVGFVKSLLIAAYYGTSAELDVYVLSLAPFRLVSGVLLGSIQAAFIPRYLDLISRKGKQQAWTMFLTFLCCMMLGTGFVSIMLILGSPFIAEYLGAGFTAHQVEFTESLLKLSALVLIFNMLGETGRYVFSAHKRFVLSAFIPLLSIIVSLGYLLYYHIIGVSALMYGLILGMLVQGLVIMYLLRRFYAEERLTLFSPFHPEIQQTIRVMMPLLIGTAFAHANIVIDQMMASTLPGGSIASLHYAVKLHSLFSQVFIMAVSRAALPFFAQQSAEHAIDALKETFLLTGKRMLYILLPISVCILVFGEPIIRLLFQRGAFNSYSTSATAGAWMAYAIGLPVQAIGILTARVYNALQENKTLMYVSGGSVILNILFNWIFMKPWGHVGIALSTSGVYTVTTVVLLSILRKKLRGYAASTATIHE